MTVKNFSILIASSLFILFCLTANAQNAETILLKNYRPESIYNIPKTTIGKAKFPVIDMHAHPNALTEEGIRKWIKTMDQFGIAKTIILSYQTGKYFDTICNIYKPFSSRFEVWCGFDYTGYQEPGWSEKAVKELERCYKAGARGVGELGDKGLGETYSGPVPAFGMHVDDPKMKPLFQKCGQLGMPVNIHVAEPMWMYQPMDSTNDGLMNAYSWRIDKTKPGLLSHQELIQTLENVVKENPATTFIACHLANCEYDLSIIGRLLKKYKNLYADISARYGETAAIPRYMLAFYKEHQDKLLYGTDMGTNPKMYAMTLRILESNDEHFYDDELRQFHYPMNGFGLPDEVLKKLYNGNASKILNKK